MGHFDHFADLSLMPVAAVLQFTLAFFLLCELAYIRRVIGRARLRKTGVLIAFVGAFFTGAGNLAQASALYAGVILMMSGLIVAAVARIVRLNSLDVEVGRVRASHRARGFAEWWATIARIGNVLKLEAEKLWARIRSHTGRGRK